MPVTSEGVLVQAESIITLPFKDDQPVYPMIDGYLSEEFMAQVQKPGKIWIMITAGENQPRLSLDSDNLIRTALFPRMRWISVDADTPRLLLEMREINGAKASPS